MTPLKDKKIAIVTDSSCDLPKDIIERYGIHVVALRVISSQGEFRDGIDINAEQLYAMMKNELPKTSLPLPDEILKVYENLKNESYTDILHISISSKLSGTFNICKLMAEEFEEKNDIKIHVIDSLTLSAALGMLVVQSAQMIEAGFSIEKTIESISETRENQLGCFVVKTLEYLRKGGRIGLVEGVLGTLLRIHPVVYVNKSGIYETLSKARGYLNAIDIMLKEVLNRYKGKKINVAVVHGAASEEANRILGLLKESLSIATSFIHHVSPVLAIHTGPGLVGIIAQEVMEIEN